MAGQGAWVAVAQIPMIVALAGKNNLISRESSAYKRATAYGGAVLTGIGYEKLNFLHRAAGRTCLAGIWIHALGHIIPNRGISLASWRAPITQWVSNLGWGHLRAAAHLQ